MLHCQSICGQLAELPSVALWTAANSDWLPARFVRLAAAPPPSSASTSNFLFTIVAAEPTALNPPICRISLAGL